MFQNRNRGNYTNLLSAGFILLATLIAQGAETVNSETFLKNCVITRPMIDYFFSGEEIESRGIFDKELGYIFKNAVRKDGIDGSSSICTFMPSGARQMIQFNNRPCRINTYGDSFTFCSQVNDGETWQEYLAAHLGEPVRNFGVGGHGVYQAYLRMLREEKKNPADYILFTIFYNDHFRSNFSWRWSHLDWVRKIVYEKPSDFCLNPWPYVTMNLETGNLEEVQNKYNPAINNYELSTA